MRLHFHYTTNFMIMFFFFNDTATTEIYTLSLHDALPIFAFSWLAIAQGPTAPVVLHAARMLDVSAGTVRSEEHTSELQSQSNLVCRLLLEKKKYPHDTHTTPQPAALHSHGLLVTSARPPP